MSRPQLKKKKMKIKKERAKERVALGFCRVEQPDAIKHPRTFQNVKKKTAQLALCLMPAARKTEAWLDLPHVFKKKKN